MGQDKDAAGRARGHDYGYKLLFSHPEMVADLIRGYVREPWVERLDFSTLSRVSDGYVSEDLREREDDMVWRVRWAGDGQWLYVYLLLEFQSSPERFMALRLMTYLGLLYEDLRKGAQLTTSGRLPPVLPVVLYSGSRRWQAPEEVAELIETVPGGLERYRPQLRYLLLDESRFRDDGLPEVRNLAAALFALENSRRPEDMERVLERLVAWLRRPEQTGLRRSFTVWIKRVLLPARVPGVDLEQVADLQEVRSMLAERVEEWTRDWKQQGIEEGRREGRELGREEGREEGRKEGGEAVLLRLVEMRFGAEAAETHRARIEQADSETLLRWSERILTAKRPEDLFA
ncbi:MULTISPECIES: Rpn family recombination-promoting nuclease/putative transposase [unclassified Thioalkalivibrio]|uniref:Rpn family recombination-promoting nuclease/putative transposase n=1 Tax=unclassified Thioalkalivibrio TaxID=2621013 RepID=UPI00035F1A89|nr:MULTISPECIES: Rpn family recombination-promoting nuclease/putative transposase [unclassified Thioalkalivibrio]